jgi:hypothetical protein
MAFCRLFTLHFGFLAQPVESLASSQNRLASKLPLRRQPSSLRRCALLTMLGAAGEALGFDKHLKASTTKRRTHSLFRQGCLHYYLLPTMQEARLRPLMEKFVQLMLKQPLFADIYGLI